MKEVFEISQQIKTALGRGAPVVAFESTVFAHGLPRDKASQALDAMIQETNAEGCASAVIGIVEGKITVGLSDDDARRIIDGKDVMKVSTREIAEAIVYKKYGATTVAATACISSNAGIPVMATGGIGGVHRGASMTGDISADLFELARTPIIVVCSGAKSVLDIPATLEWLETHQIPVYGYQTDEFPVFYSRKSGLKVPRLEKPEEVSELYLTRLGLGQRSAMVVAVPIPEKSELDVTDIVENAVEAAKKEGITGPALTPWLLAKVQEMSGGKAVDANISLLANNARIAARIAAELIGRQEKRIGFNVV